nr:hypothetical protein BaRGS_001502 [Batillaria attramentaria]
MERLVNARLVWVLESEGLLSDLQCGFRQGRSTIDHLVRFESFIRDDCQEQEMGVPQGSILSPVLFSLKINNIVKSVTKGTDASLFVDDFALCVKGKSLHRAAGVDINSVEESLFPATPPWTLPIPEVRLDLTSHKKAETPDPIYFHGLQQILADFPGFRRIFTDGSKSEDGRVGAAAVMDAWVTLPGACAPAGIVLWVIEVHKPLPHDKGWTM